MGLLAHLYVHLPRLIYVAFSLYGLGLVLFRWQVTRLLTMERRFLLLFFLLELGNTVASGLIKTIVDAPVDPTAWLTVLTQSFLAAYLHYSVPREYRSLRRRLDVRRRRRR